MLRLKSIAIDGYKPFKDFQAEVGPLEVLIGANGSGKSSLFEFLRFIRDGVNQPIPPEIITGWVGQRIFHQSGPERFSWVLEFESRLPGIKQFEYTGELLGPVGLVNIARERVGLITSSIDNKNLLEMRGGNGVQREPGEGSIELPEDQWKKISVSAGPNQLALSQMTRPSDMLLRKLREYMLGWRFYGTFKLATDKIRRTVLVTQAPLLDEDCSNLSSVLHYLMTEHQDVFEELQYHLKSVIPGFNRLVVKARGGPGEVIALWQERGVESELSLADLSDGILRLLCWTVLCLQPNPPALICIDEPDQGLHPRVMPLLAGLFERASARAQIFLTTHSSYFLLQFELSRLAVLRKENGAAKFFKPANSATLVQNLQDFGPAELELMHRSDELELLA